MDRPSRAIASLQCWTQTTSSPPIGLLWYRVGGPQLRTHSDSKVYTLRRDREGRRQAAAGISPCIYLGGRGNFGMK